MARRYDSVFSRGENEDRDGARRRGGVWLSRARLADFRRTEESVMRKDVCRVSRMALVVMGVMMWKGWSMGVGMRRTRL